MASSLRELELAVSRLTPQLRPKLRPPATQREIGEAAKRTGLALPSEYYDFLVIHNGQDFQADDCYADPLVPELRRPSFCSCQWFAGAEEIDQLTSRVRTYIDLNAGKCCRITGPAQPHAQYLVISRGDHHDCLALDLAPVHGGRFGQVVMICTKPFEIVVLAPDLNTFLTDLAFGYASGKYHYAPGDAFVLYAEF